MDLHFDTRKRLPIELDIAPLIDVVFLLLIFFMLTSTMVVPEAIELNLPASESATQSESTAVVISVSQSGELLLNDKKTNLDSLQNEVKTLLSNSTKEITLKSDSKVDIQKIVEVMDKIRLAGGTNIALATVPSDQ
ncbi:MAG: biopolymer transporter ExbD [Deltaproteobacteria bacterium]|nr:biopolymer transporter ExbD [Deltaproteobacteria bacterium]